MTAIENLRAEALKAVKDGWTVALMRISADGKSKTPVSVSTPAPDGKPPVDLITTSQHLDEVLKHNRGVNAWAIYLDSKRQVIDGVECIQLVLDPDDHDGKHGVEAFRSFWRDTLHRDDDPFKLTYTVRTASGGRHLHFWIAAPDDGETVKGASGFVDDVDVLMGHKLSIGPGSWRGNDTANPYTVENDAPVMPLPADLDAYVVRRTRPRPRVLPSNIVTFQQQHGGRLEAYFTKVLNDNVAELATFSSERNPALFRLAARVYSIADACGWPVSDADIESAFMGAMEANGSIHDNGEPKCFDTLNRARTKGLANPEVPDLPDRPLTNTAKITGKESPTVDADTAPGDVIGLPPQPPLEAFPAWMADLIRGLSDEFSVTPTFVAGVILNVAGSMIGRSRRLALKARWKCYGTLPLVLVANSAVGKSPIMKCLHQVVHEIQRELHARYAAEKEQYDADLEAYEKHRADGDVTTAIQGKPTPPVKERVIAKEATREALERMLCDSPRGVLLVNDEIVSFLCNLERLGGSDRAFKGFLLEWLDGGEVDSNRTDDERSRHADEALISIAGGVQPKRLEKVFSSEDFDSGLLPRLVMLRGVIERPAVFDTPTTPDALVEKYERMVRHLHGLEMTRDADGYLVPQDVTMSQEARSLFAHVYDAIGFDSYVNQGDDRRVSVIKKALNQFGALILVMHEIGCIDKGLDDVVTPVTADTVRRAHLLTQWCAEHRGQVLSMFGKKKTLTPAAVEFISAVNATIKNGKAEVLNDVVRISNAAVQAALPHRVKGRSDQTAVGMLARSLGCKGVTIERGVRGLEVPRSLLESTAATGRNEAMLPPLPVDDVQPRQVQEIDEDTVALV